MIETIARELEQGTRLCLTILPFMFAGCLAGSLMAHCKFGTRRRAFFSPIARLSGLHGPATIYLPLCFLDHHSANAYLSSLSRKGVVRKRGILGIYLIGFFPSSLYFHIFFTAPILYPVLGFETATTVLGLYLLASLLTFCCGVVLTRFVSSPDRQPPVQDASCQTDRPAWRMIMRDAAGQFRRMAIIFVPCILAVELLLAVPAVQSAMDKADVFLAWFEVPSEGALVAMSALPNIMVGYATAATCLDDSLITLAQIPKILMLAALGNVVFSTFSYFFSANVAAFGTRRGTYLTFAGLGVRLPWLFLSLYLASLIE
ncbi:hypothetical protein [Desulfolutivibrio sulfoxidireducens]|uniref:hypothetical protein n=1 Tax=Desulfolutivibrio sulfoxidireducens TaxID=2773299 RepID=UPI00159D967C|nr:hypothetical protein [Desulfolutivibrio sulfoxidireducens]QLA20335.1 hypothetical protein GD604_11765 [Desulfolutivibrio sulfoxidireducens]